MCEHIDVIGPVAHCKDTATHCNALYHTAKKACLTTPQQHCERLQHSNKLHSNKHRNKAIIPSNCISMLLRVGLSATHHNTLQHSHKLIPSTRLRYYCDKKNCVQHTTTHRNTPQHTATHRNPATKTHNQQTFEHIIAMRTVCNTPQHTATRCNTAKNSYPAHVSAYYCDWGCV